MLPSLCNYTPRRFVIDYVMPFDEAWLSAVHSSRTMTGASKDEEFGKVLIRDSHWLHIFLEQRCQISRRHSRLKEIRSKETLYKILSPQIFVNTI